MELENEATAPIIRNSVRRILNAVQLLEAQPFPKGTEGVSTKIKVSQSVTPLPDTQTFVTVNTYQARLIFVEPNKNIQN